MKYSDWGSLGLAAELVALERMQSEVINQSPSIGALPRDAQLPAAVAEILAGSFGGSSSLPAPQAALKVLQAFNPGSGLTFQQRYLSGGEEYVASNYFLGDGSDEAATLNSLLVAIGSTRATLTFPANFKVTIGSAVATPIPDTLTLRVRPGGGIQFGATTSLLLSGDPYIEAGPYPVFYGQTGNFQFVNAGSQPVIPEWFGASTAATDNLAAFNFWIDACHGAGNIVAYKRPMAGLWGHYQVSDEVRWLPGRNRVIKSIGRGLQFSNTQTGFTIVLTAGTKASPKRSVVCLDAGNGGLIEGVTAHVGGNAAALQCFYVTNTGDINTYGTSTHNIFYGCIAGTEGVSGNSYVKYGFRMGSLEQVQTQVDNNVLFSCWAVGDWDNASTADVDAGWFDSGFYFGDGIPANCLNHNLFGCQSQYWRYGITTDATNTYAEGGHFDTSGGLRGDGRVGAIWHIKNTLNGPSTVCKMRVEGAGGLVYSDSGNTGSVFLAEMSDLIFEGQNVGPELFRWNTGGTLKLRNVIGLNFTGTYTNPARIVGQAAGCSIVYENCSFENIPLDQLANSPDVLSSGAFNSGPAIVLGSYTENNSGATVRTWRGPILLNGSTAISGATPSVAGYDHFLCGNASPTTITDFANGSDDQVIHVELDANTTIQHNWNIHLAGGVDAVGASGGKVIITFRRLAGVWREIHRTSNATSANDAVETAIATIGDATVSLVLDSRRNLYMPNGKPRTWTDYRGKAGAVSLQATNGWQAFDRTSGRLVGVGTAADTYRNGGSVLQSIGGLSGLTPATGITVVWVGELLAGPPANGYWWNLSGTGGSSPQLYPQDNGTGIVNVGDTHGHFENFADAIPTRGPIVSAVSIKSSEMTVKHGGNAAVVHALTEVFDAGSFGDVAIGSGTGGSGQYANYEVAGFWILNQYFTQASIDAIAAAYSGYAH